ncbi:hypothetical protein BDK51DRAFT_46753 [Blyttiomyces helicus]|uniref:Uncharacterized protein n=1 Tax=Blyttiomyces helicus TaxID=388810 RepID=A0A4P9WSV0_9FUNG|nr:hypothetical protein BDK51DRAFT_46753 [Blyttiomyces helicus]|eukprot:RKO94390.1 hypothetical protein BDK51DRAFT_46753 [Blyttiomyces helicus]
MNDKAIEVMAKVVFGEMVDPGRELNGHLRQVPSSSLLEVLVGVFVKKLACRGDAVRNNFQTLVDPVLPLPLSALPERNSFTSFLKGKMKSVRQNIPTNGHPFPTPQQHITAAKQPSAPDVYIHNKDVHIPISATAAMLLRDIPNSSTKCYTRSFTLCKGMPFIYMENALGRYIALTNGTPLFAKEIICDERKPLLPSAPGLNHTLKYLPAGLLVCISTGNHSKLMA